MSRLENLLVGALLLIGLLAAGWFGLDRYGAAHYDTGYAAAVAAGEKVRDGQAEANRKTEANLRAQLATRDTDAFKKEQTYAETLQTAQRRVRDGTDRLRCPASPIPAGAAPVDRPASAGAAVDGEGSDFVPDTAAALLGDAANVAGLVRRYERVVERFEACRKLNAGP